MKDLEFHVDRPNGTTLVTHDFGEACTLAVSIGCSNGQPINIDVVAWTRASARAWAGDDGAERFEEDPDASVFERIVIKAESLGRIA